MILPNRENRAVSSVIKPVTHTAEVEVNNASVNVIFSFPFQAAGNESKPAPMKISRIKNEKSMTFSELKYILIDHNMNTTPESSRNGDSSHYQLLQLCLGEH